MADRGALPGGSLQEYLGFEPPGRAVDRVEGAHHALEPGFLPGSRVGARVEDKARDSQGLAPLELNPEGLHRFFSERWIGGGNVEQVGRMSDHRGEACFFGSSSEPMDLLLPKRRRLPGPLVLGEDLDGIAAGFLGPVEGGPKAPGDRHMSSKQHAQSLLARSALQNKVPCRTRVLNRALRASSPARRFGWQAAF